MYFIEDEKIAENLQRSLNVNKEYSPAKGGGEHFELTDPQLEYHDPTPNIHELFVSFDRRYFWGKLGMVEVKWSRRMTKCAGLCYYQGKRGLCSIKLSAPLLSLRPRKDLVETLLHEMIHAYLFITENDDDREGHGPQFRKHMRRINKEAGTNITVYHTFYDEVAYYEKHIWRCNGICQNKRPYFGFVKRTINRAPGPNDFWWKEHQYNCGGTFIKVSEPEKHCKKKIKKDKDKAMKNNSNPGNSRDIRDFLQVETPKILSAANSKDLSNTQNMKNSYETNVIKSKTDDEEDKNEYLRVRATVRNAWANKYLSPSKTEEKPNSLNISSPITIEMKRKQVSCPVCSASVSETLINEHIDECLSKEKCVEIVHETIPVKNTNKGRSIISNEESKSHKLVSCLVCSKVLQVKDLDEHLEICLNLNFEYGDNPQDDETGCDKVPCPCCLKWVEENLMNDHISDCLTNILSQK